MGIGVLAAPLWLSAMALEAGVAVVAAVRLLGRENSAPGGRLPSDRLQSSRLLVIATASSLRRFVIATASGMRLARASL
eukprot:8671357-Heterocapsa_arctica.AAC.1